VTEWKCYYISSLCVITPSHHYYHPSHCVISPSYDYYWTHACAAKKFGSTQTQPRPKLPIVVFGFGQPFGKSDPTQPNPACTLVRVWAGFSDLKPTHLHPEVDSCWFWLISLLFLTWQSFDT
jgi:hypothetical protein